MSTSNNLKDELLLLSEEKLIMQCKSLKLSTEGIKLDIIERIMNKMSETSGKETHALPAWIETNSTSITSVTCTSMTSNHSYSGYTAVTPIFPNKSRKGRKYIPIHELVAQIKEWIEQVLDMKFKSEFFEQLKDGMILCNLLNKIKPGTCYKYKKSDRIYAQKENMKIYLAGCRALGIHKNNCFKHNDLVVNYNLKSNQRQIINNLHSVIKMAKRFEIEAQNITISFLDTNEESEVKENCEMAILTPENTSNTSHKKKKHKFKLVDDSTSISMSFSGEHCIISHTNKQKSDSEEMESLSNDSYMDTKSYTDKEKILSSYFRKYEHKYKFIQEIVALYCIGDMGSLHWSLSQQDVEEFVEEEEDFLQNHRQLILDNGNIVIDVSMSHNDDIMSFTVENVNKIEFIAYLYCKCLNNGCIINKVYNTMNGNNSMMDMDLMDITIWQKQNALKFKQAFMSLNNTGSTQKSAKYFRIPYLNEKLKFMFYCEILSVHNNVNMYRQIEYKWDNVNKIQIEKQNGLFTNVELYSDNFGCDTIEYDKCWTIFAKYSEFYQQFYIALKLLKLPFKIKSMKIVCILKVDRDKYNKITQIDLINNCCEWDTVRIEPHVLNQKIISIGIGIIEAYDTESNLIQKTNWQKYGIM